MNLQSLRRVGAKPSPIISPMILIYPKRLVHSFQLSQTYIIKVRPYMAYAKSPSGLLGSALVAASLLNSIMAKDWLDASLAIDNLRTLPEPAANLVDFVAHPSVVAVETLPALRIAVTAPHIEAYSRSPPICIFSRTARVAKACAWALTNPIQPTANGHEPIGDRRMRRCGFARPARHLI